MTTINLRDFYPFYHNNLFIEVPDEVAAELNAAEHREAAYQLRTYRHHAYYSLDRGDGIEHDALFVALSPSELYERKVTAQELYTALDALPRAQSRRIYAHFILGMSKAAIARAEGVNKVSVGESIERGLRSLEKFLKNSLG